MDVHDAGTLPGTPRWLSRSRAANRPPSRARVGEALGEWQASEVRHMGRHPHCRGLSHAQLEDLYQETVLALLNRRFFNEEHIRNALRYGISKRALHVHRDGRRRAEILTEHAPEAHLTAQRRSEMGAPEQAALTREDGAIVLEFIAELTPLERQIYALEAEGLRYRAIAPVLRVEVNTARKASRAVASKRARFQLLHDTGRLCGYRAPAIRALIAGQATSEELALGAFAHLEACASCRAEHRTNSRRLRMSFQQRAAALLPVPALAGHLGWITRVDLRMRSFVGRWLPGVSSPGGGLRERALTAVTGGGVAAKLAAAGATVAVIAGGTLGATHLPSRHRPIRAHARIASVTGARPAAGATRSMEVSPAAPQPSPAGHSDANGASSGGHAHEPGGFAFLGVPTGHTESTQVTAREASARPREVAEQPAGSHAPEDQHGGGPFSP